MFGDIGSVLSTLNHVVSISLTNVIVFPSSLDAMCVCVEGGGGRGKGSGGGGEGWQICGMSRGSSKSAWSASVRGVYHGRGKCLSVSGCASEMSRIEWLCRKIAANLGMKLKEGTRKLVQC